MDPLLQLTQQSERPEAHNEQPSTAPDGQAGQAPGLPAAPSMREVPTQARLLPLMTPPPAPAEAVRSSLPTPAVGGKRSATGAGLEADPNTNGKRVKVSHTADAGVERFQQMQEEGMELDGVRERDPGTQLADDMTKKLDFNDWKDVIGFDAWLDLLPAPSFIPRIGIKTMHSGNISLYRAICNGQVDIVQSLLKVPGNNANATHLHMAVEAGQVAIVRVLLKTPGIDVNEMCHNQTPLRRAVRGRQVAISLALIKTPGIDFAARDGHGDTALRIAVKDSLPSPIIDALLAAQRINACSKEFYARHIEFLAAAEAGDLVQVRSLLTTVPWLDVNFKKRDQTALKLAVGKSHMEVVQKLLAMPGIVVDGDTCAQIAHWAAKDGHLPLLRLMLGMPGFDVNKRYEEAPYYEKVPYLVTAAKNGHFPLVQALLAAPGINVNETWHSGITALYAACVNNHYQIAMLLAVTPGIDVNASKKYVELETSYMNFYQTCSPLKLVAVRGNLRLVRALLDAERIDVNVKDNDDLTPLMYAAHHGHLEIVRAFLARPGEVSVHHCSDYVPYYGREIKGPFSALSLAERAGNRQIVEALLAMPEPFWSIHRAHRDLHQSLLERSRRAPPKPEKKQIPEQTYRFLYRILHPGFDTGSPLSLFSPDQQQRPSWLEQKCMDVSLGTCPVTDVPFLLKSTMPLPAWCQAALANAIALGFAAGHYRSAPAAFWKPLQARQAWLAGLAFGASESRQDAIELDAGISHELEAMGLWNEFLNTLETLRKLKADPDGVHLDSLTLLGWAARDGDLPMIRYLVALGANIHLRSPNGDAPILAAARAGQWAACAELLSLGAMPYRVDRKGYPALFHIASAFANSDTASLVLAKLIRYLRLKNVRFDIPVPNPDEETREENPTVLISDILVSNPEPWALFGKDVFGIREALLPALAAVPALPAPPPLASMTPKADIHAMLQSADPVAAVAAWLDADPQRLRWQDPDNGEGLLHLAAAGHNSGLVRLLLDRGVDRRHADHAGQTAAQLLPAEYMSSHTPAVADIAALLR